MEIKYKWGNFARSEHLYATMAGWLILALPLLTFPMGYLFYLIPWAMIGYLIWKPRLNKHADYPFLVGLGMLMVWPYMLFLSKTETK